jgi:hypothetical protein
MTRLLLQSTRSRVRKYRKRTGGLGAGCPSSFIEIVKLSRVPRNGRIYFGTLKRASLLVPKLYVSSRVPTKYRLCPLITTSLQPEPFVILPLAPLRGAIGTGCFLN